MRFPQLAYGRSTVFAVLLSSALCIGAFDALAAPTVRDNPYEAPRRGATVVSTQRLQVRDPQAGDATVAIIKSS